MVIEQSASSQNALGEPVETWTLYKETWAEKEDLLGREFFAAQQTLGESVTRFRLRYIDGVTTKMRVKCMDAVYNIVSAADPDGRRATLVLDTVRKG